MAPSQSIQNSAPLPPNDPDDGDEQGAAVWDVLIIGCGPAGLGAAVEARSRGLSVLCVERKELMSTVIEKFPKGKPVYLDYLGVDAEFAGAVSFQDELDKDAFLERCRAYQRGYAFALHEHEEIASVRKEGALFFCTGKETYSSRTVILAIGIFGKPNTLPIDIPPGVRPRILYSLDDPAKFTGRRILVIGGGDSAVETIEFLRKRNTVVSSYRRPAFLKGERLSERNFTNIYSSSSIQE